MESRRHSAEHARGGPRNTGRPVLRRGGGWRGAAGTAAAGAAAAAAATPRRAGARRRFRAMVEQVCDPGHHWPEGVAAHGRRAGIGCGAGWGRRRGVRGSRRGARGHVESAAVAAEAAVGGPAAASVPRPGRVLFSARRRLPGRAEGSCREALRSGPTAGPPPTRIVLGAAYLFPS